VADVEGHVIDANVSTFGQTLSLKCECGQFEATRSIADLGVVAAMMELSDAAVAHIASVVKAQEAT
jgi:hypothetical protein